MLKIRDDVDLKELKKFGFVENSVGRYDYRRYIDGVLVYRVFITRNHHYIQIQIGDASLIAKSLQCLIYDLIQARISRKSLGGSYGRRYKDIRRLYKIDKQRLL